MRTEVRTERKINFATFCPTRPSKPPRGVGVSMCDGDDYSFEAVEVQLQKTIGGIVEAAAKPWLIPAGK